MKYTVVPLNADNTSKNYDLEVEEDVEYKIGDIYTKGEFRFKVKEKMG